MFSAIPGMDLLRLGNPDRISLDVQKFSVEKKLERRLDERKKLCILYCSLHVKPSKST